MSRKALIIYYHILQKCYFWQLGYLFGYRKPLITDVQQCFYAGTVKNTVISPNFLKFCGKA